MTDKPNSPWNISGPSSFAKDPLFTGTKTGKSLNQSASEAVSSYRKANGKCRGSIVGLSVKGDKLLGEIVPPWKAGKK